MNRLLQANPFPRLSNIEFLCLHLHLEGPTRHNRLHRALLEWRGIPYDPGRLCRYLNSCRLRNGGRGLVSTDRHTSTFWRARRGMPLQLTVNGEARVHRALHRLDPERYGFILSQEVG